MVEDQWSLNWRAGLRRADERAVDVGQEPVPQGDGVADELEDGIPPRPRVLVDVADLRMVAAEGVNVPYCIQRRNSSALELPGKPPMSAPTNAWPDTPSPIAIGMLSRR